MKIRLVEHYSPKEDMTLWWTERTVLGLWMGACGYIDGSMSSKKDEAVKLFERIKLHKGACETRKVVRIEAL